MIFCFGDFWQTVEQVDAMLATMKDKEKMEALKSQLRFRKKYSSTNKQQPQNIQFQQSCEQEEKRPVLE